MREGRSQQPPQARACHPLPAVPSPVRGLAPLSMPQLKAPIQKQKHQSLLTVSPSSLSGLRNVAQAAPLRHLGAPQTLGWCLKNSDCLIPLHRELAQILSGPSPTRCRPGSAASLSRGHGFPPSLPRPHRALLAPSLPEPELSC